jgi:hypothetical protein
MHRMLRTSQKHRARAGLALLDVMIGGVILGIGLAALTSVATRAIRAQGDGERRLTAAWLADEMLNLVLVEGPDQFSRRNDTNGSFTEPFEQYSYEMLINDRGVGQPYSVTAVISWPVGRGTKQIAVDALIARQIRNDEEAEPLREPIEPLDRLERWDLKLNPPEEDVPLAP